MTSKSQIRRFRPPNWTEKDAAMRQLYGTPAEPVLTADEWPHEPDDSDGPVSEWQWPDDDEFRREAEDEA